MRRWLAACVVVAIVPTTASATTAAAERVTEAVRLVDVDGVMTIDGRDEPVSMLVRVDPGEDPEHVGRAALEHAGGRVEHVTASAQPWVLLDGYDFNQDLPIVMHYNPAGEPFATEPLIETAMQQWT